MGHAGCCILRADGDSMDLPDQNKEKAGEAGRDVLQRVNGEGESSKETKMLHSCSRTQAGLLHAQLEEEHAVCISQTDTSEFL